MKTFLSLCAGAAFCILASCSEGPTKQMPYNQGINVIATSQDTEGVGDGGNED